MKKEIWDAPSGNGSTVPFPGGKDARRTFGAVLRESRKKARLSQQCLAEMLGVSRHTVLNWENDLAAPGCDQVPELCSYLDISIEDFFGTGRERESLPPEERRLLNHYRALSPVGRNVLDRMAAAIAEEEPLAKDSILLDSYRIFAEYPGAVAAGTGYAFVDEKPSPVFRRKCEMNRHADAVVRVSGDSMLPVYHDGDYVYFQYASGADIGQDVVCSTSEGAVIKRVGPGRTLCSVNPDYPFGPQYEDSCVTVLGKVTGIVQKEDCPGEDELPRLRDLFSGQLAEFGRTYGISDQEP